MTAGGRAGIDRPARIVMVTPRFPPYRGGVESHTAEVSRRIAADQRFEVAVLATDLEGRSSPTERVGEVDVTRMPAAPKSSDLYYVPGLQRRIVDQRPDLVHVQGYHTLLAPMAMLAARRAHIPYMITLHSGGHSSRLRTAIRPVQIRLLRPLLRQARRIVAVSTFEAELFAVRYGVGESRIVTIPNGADLDQASAADRRRDPDLIVSMARLERYKGHERVIRALPLVRAEHPTARLTIMGDGPDEARLRALVASLDLNDAVSFESVPRAEVAGRLAEAAIVCLLSDYESQGLTIHEALAMGCRVVVNDSSALSEVLRFEQAIGVPATATTSAVADAVLRQLRNGAVPSGAVPSLPTWDACASALVGVYADVLDLPRPRPADDFSADALTMRRFTRWSSASGAMSAPSP